MKATLSTFEVKELAYNWFKKLTEHAPAEELLELVSSDADLLIEFPNTPIKNADEFRAWLHNVTHTFFDQQHVLQMLDISIDGDKAKVRLIVNWQAKTWEAPNAYSKWEGYCVHQEWEVKKDTKRNKAVIVNYKVGEFDSFKRISEIQ